MELSFLKLLNTSISAGWLILVVIALRLVLKKAPKSIHCLLWAFVAIRLVCPFSIESVFSLIPSAETVPEIYLTLEGEQRQYGAVLEVVGNSLYPQQMQVPVGASVDRVQVQDLFWTVIWMAGVGIMGLYALISWLRIYRRVRVCVHLKENIWICDAIDTPFILGLVSPRIYLPSDMGEEDQIYVLEHEKAHLKRKDHWWKPFGFVLLSIYWFHPLIWVAYILLCRDIEMACDEKVIRDLGVDGKKAYSSALLNCSVRGRLIAACPLAFGEVGVKERVKSVLNYKKPAFWLIAVAAVVCAVVAVCFLTDPVVEKELTLDTVRVLAQKGDDLDWEDFADYPHTDVGSGLYVYRYEIEGDLAVLVGGKSLETKPDYVNLVAGENQIDIRSGDLEGFILEYVEDTACTEVSVQMDPVPISELDENDRPEGSGVFLGGHNYNMWLDIPAGWVYEISDDYDKMAIAFRPEGETEGWMTLRFFPEGFGVCGTGLEQKRITLGNYTASAGYYDGKENWDFLVFEGTPGSYVAMPMGEVTWQGKYADEILEILSTARLAQGMLTEQEIVAIAQVELADVAKQEADSVTEKIAVILGEPSYMAHFHTDQELWEVGLFFNIDSSPRAVVWIDTQGKVVEHEDWNINLYVEDVSSTGLTLVCEQYGLVPGDNIGSPMELMTGAPYWIEVWNGTQWEMVPAIVEESVWTTEGWLINRNGTTRWDVNWQYLYGELESGTYRIGKNVSKGNRPGEYSHQNFYGVFRIMDIDLGTVVIDREQALEAERSMIERERRELQEQIRKMEEEMDQIP